MITSKRNVVWILFLSALMLVAAGIAAAFFTCGSQAPPETKRVIVERVATTPAQTLQLQEGGAIAPEQIAPGRKVAIVVMKGTWCKVCQAELKRLWDVAPQIRDSGGVVVGLSDDLPIVNKRLANGLGIGFQILSDEDRDQIQEWGLLDERTRKTIPGVVFLNEDGTLDRVHRGRYPGRSHGAMILGQLGDETTAAKAPSSPKRGCKH